MPTPAARIGRRGRGFTLVELLITVLMAALIMVGLNGVLNSTIGSSAYVEARNGLIRDGEFAMDRMVRTVSQSRLLLLPLADKSATNWPENIREQTVPPSPPIGDSTLATAVLAVTLPLTSDLDFNGIPDADNDGDGRIDEDSGADRNNDNTSGIYLIDDGGDGAVDEHSSNDDDEYLDDQDDDPENDVDDDNDNNVDEDPPADINGDGCPGLCGVDDDADGAVDEAGVADDDEDGQLSEDWYDPVVFLMSGTTLVQRTPVPWDENGVGGVDGRDFVTSTLAENVTRLRFERLVGSGGAQLIDITLELTTQEGGVVSLNTRVRVGGGL